MILHSPLRILLRNPTSGKGALNLADEELVPLYVKVPQDIKQKLLYVRFCRPERTEIRQQVEQALRDHFVRLGL